MIVVTTPTGQIGAEVVRRLLDGGHAVRLVVRDAARLRADVRGRAEVVEGSHDDPAVLDAALPGADALFWLVPPNRRARTAEEHYLAFARAGRAAVARHGVGHVVGISSAGHGWDAPAGVLSAAFAMDAELSRSGAAYRALSLPFFLENLVPQLRAGQEPAFSLTAPGDLPLATVATRDVAATAADLLTDRSWTGQEDLPLYGPDRLTPEGIAQVIGAELGRPVAYRRITVEDVTTMLRSRGTPEGLVRDTLAMSAAVDAGIYDADRSRALVAPTDLPTWCREVLVPAVSAT